MSNVTTTSEHQGDHDDEALNTIDCHKLNVVVTGFGVFRNHEVNPSWEAIKDGQLKCSRPSVNILTKQLSVSYEEVDKIVAQLWHDFKPILMIHVGLAALETSMRIEQVARHGPYIHDDISNHAPHKELRQYEASGGSLEENLIVKGYTCKPCEFESSSSCLDIDKICTKLNKAHSEGRIALPFKKSEDAGLYVCEYTYHKSLSICDRAIFIHVPDIGEVFKLEDIREALQLAIEVLVDEVLQNKIA